MFQSSSFQKYALYALGEILLVMIGILLALQVNNWNEKQKDIRAEREYLNGILEDLNTDLDFINKLTPKYEKMGKAWMEFDSLCLVGATSEKLTYNALMKIINSPKTFFAKPGIYKSLISEGNIGIIRNRELRNQIQSIYEIDYLRLEKMGDRVDRASDMVIWELREFRINLQDKETNIPLLPYRAEVAEIPDITKAYVYILIDVKRNVEKCVESLKAEIKE